MKIRYKRSIVEVKGAERHTKCEICGREGRIEYHHTRYEFKPSEVRKDPIKALKNTIAVCFQCHIYCNAVRLTHEWITKHPDRIMKIYNIMAEQRESSARLFILGKSPLDSMVEKSV